MNAKTLAPLVLALAAAPVLASASPDPWTAVFSDAGAEPALVAPGRISTGDDESHPTLAADGSTLYFLKNTPAFDFFTIVSSEWRNGTWSKPEVVPFSGRFSDADLVFTADGSHAYFVSTRPVDGEPRNDTEIWTVHRNANGWGEPKHVAALSSPADEWFPTLTADGTMYFGSAREGGIGGHDIWKSRQVDGVWQPPENLGTPVNSTGEEIEAFVTPGEDLLIIAAKNRGDSLGAYDLYLSRRRAGGWSRPVHPGAPINSAGWEFSPRLSPDGGLFLFTSNRRLAGAPLEMPMSFDALLARIRAPGTGLRDIYVMDAAALRALVE